MRTRMVLSIVLVLAIVALAGCASPQPAASPTTAPAAEQGPTVLTVKGLVGQELDLSLDGLKALGTVEITAEHPKKGPQEYAGVLLKTVLEKAGVQDGAAEVVLVAADGFEGSADLADVNACEDCLVSVGEDGALGMVMPGLSSKTWVKDVVTIEVK